VIFGIRRAVLELQINSTQPKGKESDMLLTRMGAKTCIWPGVLATSRMQCSGRCVSSGSIYRARLLAERYFIIQSMELIN